MAGSLSFRTASHIAIRELRSSRAKFTFVVLSVAIGVAALVGVRGFSASFRRELLLRARSIMAADISARTSQMPSKTEREKLSALATHGVEQTDVTELLSMASAANSFDPLLVSVKGVDPAKYPFYGSVAMEPAMPLPQALAGDQTAVGDDLLLRLKLHVGDSIRLGDKVLRIVAVVSDEPDRLSGMFAAGPRVLVSRSTLEATHLAGPGSRATLRFLFRIDAQGATKAATDAQVAELKSEIEKTLPEAQVMDYREANPAVTKALDGATGLLSLMSLVAMVLGAVGVAMAMRAHMQQRMDAIAIMKSLGAQSSHVMRIYVIQTLLLGLLGGIAGAFLGFVVQLVLPLFLAKLLHLTPNFRIDVPSLALGIGAGLLTTLLFTLPPLLDIRAVRPILMLRRAAENDDDPFVTRMLAKIANSGVQLVATFVLLVGLGLLATTVSDSPKVGLYFALGLAGILVVLLALSAGLLSLLRVFLRKTRLALPSVVRHGLANLYRPGNPSAALLAALGLGVMQLATVYMVQRSIVREMQISTSEKLPNLFLIDISPTEIDGVRAVLGAQPAVKGEPELVPVVGASLVSIDGVAVKDLKLQHMSPRAMQSLNLTEETQVATPPPGDAVDQGAWWNAEQAKADASNASVAVQKEMAQRIGVHVGSTMTFGVEDTKINATVAALYSVDSRHASSRAEFVLPQAALAGMPVIWYGGVHCDPAKTGEVKRALFEKYPTITVIDVAQTVETVRQVILQVTYVIQFLAGFSVFAGIVILASAIAGTRYRRIREVVVLKTLGGTRARIAAIFSVEFAVLGLVAGFVGLLFANGLARVLIRVMKFNYEMQWGVSTAMWLGTAVLAVAAGWAASFRVLGQKPLEVLREE